MRKFVVYIAGPFRAKCAWDVEGNVRRAEALALKVWRMGHAALCPHANTRFFDGAAPDEVWLEGDLEILRRCDTVLLTSNWRKSTGATKEAEFARELGIPVFEAEGEVDEIPLSLIELLMQDEEEVDVEEEEEEESPKAENVKYLGCEL